MSAKIGPMLTHAGSMLGNSGTCRSHMGQSWACLGQARPSSAKLCRNRPVGAEVDTDVDQIRTEFDQCPLMLAKCDPGATELGPRST